MALSRRIPVLEIVAALALATAMSGAVATSANAARSNGTASSASTSVLRQPTPSVRARDFRVERTGRAPRDNDDLIPNPKTPTGARIRGPRSCNVTFAAARGASSATVNSWIAGHENSIRRRTVLCLSGVFTSPLHVWSKTSTALLEIAPEPHSSAELNLGTVNASDINPNQYWSDAGGISIVDSRSVEIYGLTVENYTYDGTGQSPAGIYVTVRSDPGHRSACFLNHGACSNIYLIRNTVKDITNTADENFSSSALCGNSNVDGYGIAVIAAGNHKTPALQHLVIEDNTVTGTRTGQSETVTINGNVTDFLAAGNHIYDTDNIGLDTIGWETGTSQANHGLVEGNVVYNVDTLLNSSYGSWSHGTCEPGQENAAGLYDDGASYIWFDDNTVWNTDQGINLDVETAHRETDHLLVSGNNVFNSPGTSASDPSRGPNPRHTGGFSTVAGHDPYAMYIDAFGTRASIRDVYVHDNRFENQSQYFLTPSDGMPVVDLGGIWSHIEIWHNVIIGLGPSDNYNPLFEVDNEPAGGTNVVDCNEYLNLSDSQNTVNGNFASPTNDWLTLSSWQASNGHGWDRHSEVGKFAPECPRRSTQ
jgi:hypothetical protein